MRDYNYVDEAGNRTPVAKLPTSLIQELLQGEIHISDSDGQTDPVSAVRKRLQLELEIRKAK